MISKVLSFTSWKKHAHAKRICIALATSSMLFANEECPVLLENPHPVKGLGELRANAIRGWDKLLTWALSSKNKPFLHKKPVDQSLFHNKILELVQFDLNYGYFSVFHPIVGIVTSQERDIHTTNCLLSLISQHITDPIQRAFAQDEILAKVMAYRNLKKGMKIHLSKNETYVVDEVFDLWKGMPAFGLVPESKASPPILLYRGTDLNLASEKGWASVLSDLDITGPGHKTYLRARNTIRPWLEKAQQNWSSPRVVGFSLGGVFVLYTITYEHDLISKITPSTAFNPPGFSPETLSKFELLKEKERPLYFIFVNHNDFVSQIGFFPPNLWEMSLHEPMKVIEAHVTLMSLQEKSKMTAIDVDAENASRK